MRDAVSCVRRVWVHALGRLGDDRSMRACWTKMILKPLKRKIGLLMCRKYAHHSAPENQVRPRECPGRGVDHPCYSLHASPKAIYLPDTIAGVSPTRKLASEELLSRCIPANESESEHDVTLTLSARLLRCLMHHTDASATNIATSTTVTAIPAVKFVRG